MGQAEMMCTEKPLETAFVTPGKQQKGLLASRPMSDML